MHISSADSAKMLVAKSMVAGEEVLKRPAETLGVPSELGKRIQKLPGFTSHPSKQATQAAAT